MKLFLFSLFPILAWLPKYKIKEYVLPDVLGGLSAGTIQVPQGEEQQLSGSPGEDSTLQTGMDTQFVGVTYFMAGTYKPKLSLLLVPTYPCGGLPCPLCLMLCLESSACAGHSTFLELMHSSGAVSIPSLLRPGSPAPSPSPPQGWLSRCWPTCLPSMGSTPPSSPC